MNLFKQENTSFQKVNEVIYKYKSDLDFRLIFGKDSAVLRLRGISGEEDEKIVHISPDEISI